MRRTGRTTSASRSTGAGARRYGYGVNTAAQGKSSSTATPSTPEPLDELGDQNIYMPPFRPAYSDAELAAVANYVIARFSGKTGRITPETLAKGPQE